MKSTTATYLIQPHNIPLVQTIIPENTMNIYELLIPCISKQGKTILTRQYRKWHGQVEKITGGLMILPRPDGQWVSSDRTGFSNKALAERMVPIRIAATREQMERIADMTAAFYDESTVIFYLISNDATVKQYPK